MQKIALRSLQEYSADDINRRHFSDAVFLGALRVKITFVFVGINYSGILGITKHDISHVMLYCLECLIIMSYLGRSVILNSA